MRLGISSGAACKAASSCEPRKTARLLSQRALMRPFPAGPMRIWPISTRNKPENDDPSIVEPIEPATDVA